MKISEKVRQFLSYAKGNNALETSEFENDMDTGDYTLTRKEKALLKKQERLEKVEETQAIEEPEVPEEPEVLEEPQQPEEMEQLETMESSPRTKGTINFTEKIDNFKQQLEDKKEAKMEQNDEKSISLLEKLEDLKTQLENEELTPLKRLILQIKLSAIETKLDKQLAYLKIRDFKTKCQEIKDQTTQMYDEKLENINIEYDALFDKEYELQRDIELLTNNIKEREASYQNINASIKKANCTYEYHIAPNALTTLEEKQKQLDEVINQKEEKEEEIRKIEEELLAKQAAIDTMEKNQLRKYNPIAIQWNSIKSLFGRIKNNVKEWWGMKTLEKDTKKEAIKKAKEDNKAEVRRKVVEIKNRENQAMVENFKEELQSHISLQQQQEYAEQVTEQKEETEQNSEINKAEEYFRKQAEAREAYKERQKRLEGKQYQYENGNYVPVEREQKQDTKQHQEEKESAAAEYFRKQAEAREAYKERQKRLEGKQYKFENGNYIPVEETEPQTTERNETVEEERE